MDVFISYRRDTGTNMARLIKEKLTSRGVEVFFDASSIHNEDFFEKIKKSIDNASNFLMVLTPGYFVKREDAEDYVRREILYAQKKGKNILAIASETYDPDEINWEDEVPQIKKLRTFNYEVFGNLNERMEEAFFSTILSQMKGSDGRKFTLRRSKGENSWYKTYGMSEEDRLWIVSDHDVCKYLDWKMFERIAQEEVFKEREKLSLFVYKAYDIDTYAQKYDVKRVKEKEPILEKKIEQIYGITYDFYVEHANEVFGENHFIADTYESKHETEKIGALLEESGLSGFDIIDLTLSIKDRDNPEKVVYDLVQYLNPKGGVIYIRELDDDYVSAYPDEKGLIKKMCELLELDEGAGNRHTGKQVYTILKKAGADKIYMSDEVISTANHKPAYQKRICDTYFSFLLPEMKQLVAKNEEGNFKYSKYLEAYEWLKENYADVESLFRSTEFYFRAGYVAGYGTFVMDEEMYY